MAKIVKRRGSQLEVRVRKTVPRVVKGPSPPSWKSPNALRITFFINIRHRYLDSSSTLVRAEEETTGSRIMCVDNRLFFKRPHQLNYHMAISQLLESLEVKADLHDKITSQIMSMGQPKYKGTGKKVKRKILKGLRVDLTWIQTFVLDRDSVHQLVHEVLAGERIWRGTKR